MKSTFTTLLTSIKWKSGRRIPVIHSFFPSRTSYFFGLVAIINCTLLTISASVVSAQTNGSLNDDLNATVEYSNQWKSPDDYSSVITRLQENTTLLLADPNLQESEFALYTGFNRLLTYMHADLVAHVPVADIAEKNYNKVVLESSLDPVLINMKANEFSDLYVAMVQKLQ